MNDTPPMSYQEFWPYYVSEHSKRSTRICHFIGTSLVILCFILALTISPYFFLAMPFAGYFFAWTSHFWLEKNRPATFKRPLFSLLADFHMFYLTLTGRMKGEVEKYGANPR